MNKLFYIEGIDNSGKSTLAKKIVEETGAVYFHSTWSPPLNIWMVDYLKNKWIEVLEQLTKSHVVIDRHFISTLIYDKIYRQGMLFKDAEFWRFILKFIESSLSSNYLVPIICTLDFNVWKKTFIVSQQQGKEEMYELDKNLELVFMEYENLLTGTSSFKILKGLPFKKLNYMEEDFKLNNFI